MSVPVRYEKVELWLKCSEPLPYPDGRALRGFFGNLYKNRPEFHHHIGKQEFIYRHPLIQYKTINNSGLITGLQEGAYLLKGVPEIDFVELHHKKYFVSDRVLKNDVVPFGFSSDNNLYEFKTPWIGLNQKNYDRYLEIRHNKKDLNYFFKRILIGNILSMCKSLRYVADLPIRVFANIREGKNVEIKKGVNVASFEGTFESNFIIPDYWGIGKSSSRGYGTLIKRKK